MNQIEIGLAELLEKYELLSWDYCPLCDGPASLMGENHPDTHDDDCPLGILLPFLTNLRDGSQSVVDGDRLQDACDILTKHNISPLVDNSHQYLHNKWYYYIQGKDE